MSAPVREETRERLRGLIVRVLELDQDPDMVPDDGLRTALGIDSVSGLELLINVENEFGIQIDDGDLTAGLVDSLDGLAAYIEQCQAAQAQARA